VIRATAVKFSPDKGPLDVDATILTSPGCVELYFHDLVLHQGETIAFNLPLDGWCLSHAHTPGLSSDG
jgi:hypothetical protein